MIFSVGIILTPQDWNFGWDTEEEVSIIILGPFVIALERIYYE